MLILDIDNTLLPSREAADYAISRLHENWKDRPKQANKPDREEFRELYEKCREETKQALKNHTSQRLRILYFKKMVESQSRGFLERRDLQRILDLEKKYFRYFVSFLQKYKNRHRKEYKQAFSLLREIQKKAPLAFLTNENLRTQLLKLKDFLPKDLNFRLVVSEEWGIEKPNPELFRKALGICSVSENIETSPDGISFASPGKPLGFMVGDNWTDDIEGGIRSGLSVVYQTEIWGDPDYLEKMDNGGWKTSNLLTSLKHIRYLSGL